MAKNKKAFLPLTKKDLVNLKSRWDGMDTFGLEAQFTILRLLWGIIIACFGSNAFYNAITFSVMDSVLPANAWGLISVVIAILNFVALAKNSIKSRKRTALAGTALWIFTAVSLALAGSITALIVYGTLASFNAAVYVRLSKLKAYIENY